MPMMTTRELELILLGLCHQYDTIRECVNTTCELPDVNAEYQADLRACDSAYAKIQKLFLQSQAEDLRKELGL